MFEINNHGDKFTEIMDSDWHKNWLKSKELKDLKEIVKSKEEEINLLDFKIKPVEWHFSREFGELEYKLETVRKEIEDKEQMLENERIKN